MYIYMVVGIRNNNASNNDDDNYHYNHYHYKNDNCCYCYHHHYHIYSIIITIIVIIIIINILLSLSLLQLVELLLIYLTMLIRLVSYLFLKEFLGWLHLSWLMPSGAQLACLCWYPINGITCCQHQLYRVYDLGVGRICITDSEFSNRYIMIALNGMGRH